MYTSNLETHIHEYHHHLPNKIHSYTSDLEGKLAKLEHLFNTSAKLSPNLQDSNGHPQVFIQTICGLQSSVQETRELLRISSKSFYQQMARLEQSVSDLWDQVESHWMPRAPIWQPVLLSQDKVATVIIR